jgi:hypothetical protein
MRRYYEERPRPGPPGAEREAGPGAARGARRLDTRRGLLNNVDNDPWREHGLWSLGLEPMT